MVSDKYTVVVFCLFFFQRWTQTKLDPLSWSQIRCLFRLFRFLSTLWSLATHYLFDVLIPTLPLFHPRTLTQFSSVSISGASPGPDIFLGYLLRKHFQGGDGDLGPIIHLLEDAKKPKLKLKHSSRDNWLSIRSEKKTKKKKDFKALRQSTTSSSMGVDAYLQLICTGSLDSTINSF